MRGVDGLKGSRGSAGAWPAGMRCLGASTAFLSRLLPPALPLPPPHPWQGLAAADKERYQAELAAAGPLPPREKKARAKVGRGRGLGGRRGRMWLATSCGTPWCPGRPCFAPPGLLLHVPPALPLPPAVGVPAVLRLAHGGHQGGQPQGERPPCMCRGWASAAPCLLARFPRPPLAAALPHSLRPQAGLPERSKLLAAEWAGLTEDVKQPFLDRAKVGGWACSELGRQSAEGAGGGGQLGSCSGPPAGGRPSLTHSMLLSILTRPNRTQPTGAEEAAQGGGGGGRRQRRRGGGTGAQAAEAQGQGQRRRRQAQQDRSRWVEGLSGWAGASR